jgi:hypothetical protein
MKIRFFTAILLSVTLCACEDESGYDTCEFEPETVLIGTKANVTLGESFDIINDYGLTIRQVSGIKYVSAIGSDSIDYIIQQLNKKSYINAHGFGAVEGGSVYIHYLTGELCVLTHLWDMTLANQQDWVETIVKLRLTEVPKTKSFNLQVDPLTERWWIKQFLSNESTEYAELNCYFEYGPS